MILLLFREALLLSDGCAYPPHPRLGCPVIVVGLTLAVSFGKYKADDRCWLNVQHNTIWAFAGPVLFILSVSDSFVPYWVPVPAFPVRSVCRHWVDIWGGVGFLR